MKTVIGPAGWYCDARPDFGYVFLARDSHLETHAGRVELPDHQNLLYIDIAPTGNRFAGVGHRDDQAWEWNGDEWICHGRAIGPRAVMYGAEGRLYVDDAGKPVPTDRSMADVHRQLWQYTTHDGTTVGQGGKGSLGEDPVVVVIDGRRRLLAEGQCRFIKFRKSGSLCSVAFVREDTGQSIMRW